MQDELNRERLAEYAARFDSKALDRRVKLMMTTYGL
jgi:hypothetical protein